MVICIPSGITEVEKRAVFDSADHVDSKETYLIHEPMAAALGIGLNIEEPIGNMIIDIGGGTTEIAVIALSGYRLRSVHPDCRRRANQRHYGLHETRTQHPDRRTHGRADQDSTWVRPCTNWKIPPADYAVNGRDLMTGIPKQIKINYQEVAYALDKSISKIEDAVLKALEMTPPELASDIYRTGLYLTGWRRLAAGPG